MRRFVQYLLYSGLFDLKLITDELDDYFEDDFSRYERVGLQLRETSITEGVIHDWRCIKSPKTSGLWVFKVTSIVKGYNAIDYLADIDLESQRILERYTQKFQKGRLWIGSR